MRRRRHHWTRSKSAVAAFSTALMSGILHLRVTLWAPPPPRQRRSVGKRVVPSQRRGTAECPFPLFDNDSDCVRLGRKKSFTSGVLGSPLRGEASRWATYIFVLVSVLAGSFFLNTYPDRAHPSPLQSYRSRSQICCHVSSTPGHTNQHLAGSQVRDSTSQRQRGAAESLLLWARRSCACRIVHSLHHAVAEAPLHHQPARDRACPLAKTRRARTALAWHATTRSAPSTRRAQSPAHRS
mmetsp:Transcript_13930/g.35952  ORF Transcript_13930/g.35952 Transcript_13930/m.35952 type:complete len:239 (-) Transcript_13930:155-871(-)